MLRRFYLILIFALALGAVALVAQEEKKEMEMMPMGPPPEMKEIANLEGTWDMDMQMRSMDKPDVWEQSRGTSVCKFILQGNAMEMRYDGPEFSGLGIHCYDREKREWQMVWIDNWSGRLALYTGNAKGDTLVMYADDLWQGKSYKVKTSTFNRTDTSFDWQMDMSEDGGKTWYTCGKAKYTKRI